MLIKNVRSLLDINVKSKITRLCLENNMLYQQIQLPNCADKFA